MSPKRIEYLVLVGVTVSGLKARDAPGLFHGLHDTDVGELPDGSPRNVSQRIFVVERRGQGRCEAGEESLLPLDPGLLRDVAQGDGQNLPASDVELRDGSVRGEFRAILPE